MAHDVHIRTRGGPQLQDFVMPQYVLSFEVDIPTALPAIYDLAADHGWSIRIESSRKVRYRMPPNALVGTFDSLDGAETGQKKLFDAAQRSFGRPVKVTKFVLAECAKVRFDSDDRKAAAPPRAAKPPSPLAKR